jgi:predicted amidohydrolase
MSSRASDHVNIGLVQMQMDENRELNVEKAVRMVGEACQKGAQIVCLPELFSSLYFPQDKTSKEEPVTIPSAITGALSKAARENKVVVVGGSIYEKAGKNTYNSSVLFDQRGRILGKYRKVHIPQDQSFFEQDYFTRGNNFAVLNTKYAKIGLLICFDQWYPEPVRIEKLMGAEIIFYPTAIGWVKGIDPVEGDWHEAWQNVQVGHAISNSVIVVAVNRVGVEKDMQFWGGSFVCDQFGKLLARADDKEQVIVTSCDLTLGKNIEEGWGFQRNRVPRSYSRLSK